MSPSPNNVFGCHCDIETISSFCVGRIQLRLEGIVLVVVGTVKYEILSPDIIVEPRMPRAATGRWGIFGVLTRDTYRFSICKVGPDSTWRNRNAAVATAHVYCPYCTGML